MENGRIFIIGDIHGCLGMLKSLLKKICWNPKEDSLIFLGDYVDRGNDSRGVIDLILEISRYSEHVHCLMGNHENLFLEYLIKGNITAFLFNGGDTTLDSYRSETAQGDEIDIPDEHVSFLKSLEPWLELDDYYIVHAGFLPGVPIEKQNFDDLIWIRDPFIYSDYNFGKRVIFGHTPFSEPLIMDNKIGLDTGAVYGNKLTCLELPAFIFHFSEV